ncbi:hypothetical protein [Cylindrospermopsis raciborskii]|uniref:hypothetical protein n=1 Tax=Cylindrospermopsis raciborskii TaxID=77022 RepID=UPI0015C47E4A|nr:hypothetical protein [Cylindrospermopsis raciborskii]
MFPLYYNFELGSREQDGRSRVGSTVRSPFLKTHSSRITAAIVQLWMWAWRSHVYHP